MKSYSWLPVLCSLSSTNSDNPKILLLFSTNLCQFLYQHYLISHSGPIRLILITPILWKKKLRLWEVKHISWIWILVCLTSELRLFVIRPRCLPASCPLLHFSGGWLSWWLSGKESACNAGAAGDAGLIPGSSGRSPGGRQGNLLQYSCLENPMDRGARWAGYSPEVRKELNTIEAT